MTARIPIGVSDFTKLRRGGFTYVDKSRLIVDVLARAAEVLLIPRPRRFGKTLNLSMLGAFLALGRDEAELAGRRELFEDLAVWRSPAAREHFGRYPVVFLTFKDVKARTWEETLTGIRNVTAALYEQHRGLLGGLSESERRSFDLVVNRQAEAGDLWTVLADLTRWLHSQHGERAVVLIDEYDIPIQAGFSHGFFDDVAQFFRNFLSSGLKDNPHLAKGVLTGILRVAKESIFSGLNNVQVHSILSGDFLDAFGFTPGEVRQLCEEAGTPEHFQEIERWYDGYRFGARETIYNPWSVLCFLDAPEDGLRPYWVFTSSDDALRQLVFERRAAVGAEVEALLRGESVQQEVSEHVVLRDLDQSPTAVWSLLLLTGYLTTRRLELDVGRLRADLALPNEELRYVWEQSITTWLADGLAGSRKVDALLRALLDGDALTLAQLLSTLVVRTFSYHDTGGAEPERVYQAFLLGLLVHLNATHDVRSNRESGYGRYDVMVLPRSPGHPGVVIECKQLSQFADETVEDALASAMDQIERRRYAEDLAACGAQPIHRYGLVFDGKRVWVRHAS